jgi:hypothetical protein
MKTIFMDLIKSLIITCVMFGPLIYWVYINP